MCMHPVIQLQILEAKTDENWKEKTDKPTIFTTEFNNPLSVTDRKSIKGIRRLEQHQQFDLTGIYWTLYPINYRMHTLFKYT